MLVAREPNAKTQTKSAKHNMHETRGVSTHTQTKNETLEIVPLILHPRQHKQTEQSPDDTVTVVPKERG